MIIAVALSLLGLLLLALGGDSIVKGASGLARHVGASPFVAGLILVAFGTSLPELSVNLMAILSGQQSLALGNAVGSNVVNFGLTLAVAACAAPLVVRWRALAPLLAMLVFGTLGVLFLGRDGVLSRGEGVLMLLAFVGVLAFALARSRSEPPEVHAMLANFTEHSVTATRSAVRFLIGAAFLWLGAVLIVGGGGPHLLGTGLGELRAVRIGEALGLSPLLTGLLPVAIGTALPEVAAAVAAARRGQGDLVAGHVIGASLFNLLVVIGGMAAYNALPLPLTPMALPLVDAEFALPLAYEWLAALAFTAMLYPMLKGDLRFSRREGAMLLAVFVAWVVFELVMIRG